MPITLKELKNQGISSVDVIIVSGDAFVDHPSFGTAVIARMVEHAGFSVAIVAQPNWQDDLRDFKKFGKPKLCFAVTAGATDSMVANYTAMGRLRSDDSYTPGGQAGFRPIDATIVYSKILKQLFPDSLVVLGGVEASLRRLSYYHYVTETIRPSVLVESGADFLLHGLSEHAFVQFLYLLERQASMENLRALEHVAYVEFESDVLERKSRWQQKTLHSHEDCLQDRKKFLESTSLFYQNINQPTQFLQRFENKLVVVNPARSSWSQSEIDLVYGLPYTRMPHPKYKKRGPIPAFEMIKYSINIHRGCFGGCNFCAIALHQGKKILSRSRNSILKELKSITEMEGFSGIISDMGGPSANMYKMGAIDSKCCDKCSRHSCVYPSVCKNLNIDHQSLLEIYSLIKTYPGIKKAFIGSGIRYDFAPEDYLEIVLSDHISGRIKVAPEHTEDSVLSLMGKPSFTSFLKFLKFVEKVAKKLQFKLEIVPYLISNHPGCTRKDMEELVKKVNELNLHVEQVQSFTPTPMTLSTAMYYAKLSDKNVPIEVASTSEEKKKRHELFFNKAK